MDFNSCIDLTTYARVLGVLHQLAIIVGMIYLIGHKYLEQNILTFGIFIYSFTFHSAAAFLVVGTCNRSIDIVERYWKLTICAIVCAFIAMCVYIFILPKVALYILVFIILSALLVYPIYLLSEEIKDEAC